MSDNFLADLQYCPFCHKELDYDGSCGCIANDYWESYDDDFC